MREMEELLYGIEDRLKEKRNKEGLSAVEMAQKIGIGEKTYLTAEKNANKLFLEKLVLIGRYYGESIFSEPQSYGQAIFVSICKTDKSIEQIAKKLKVSNIILGEWLRCGLIPDQERGKKIKRLLKPNWPYPNEVPMFSEDFTEVMVSYIKNNKLSLTGFAKKVGLRTQDDIYQWVVGRYPQKANIICNLYGLFGKDVVLIYIKKKDPVGLKLKKARIQKQLERKQLAELTGISIHRIELFERSARNIDEDSMERLKEVLGDFENRRGYRGLRRSDKVGWELLRRKMESGETIS